MKAKFNCDQLNDQEVFGWGIVETPAHEAVDGQDNFLILLRAGDTIIGQQRRTMPRPDVDKAAGQPGVNKGYRMPVLAPAAVLAAGFPDEPPQLSLNFGGIDIALQKQSGRLLDMSQFRSLKLSEAGGPLTIADLWFASERELQFRIENVRGAHGLTPPWSVRFYQPEYTGNPRLVQIAEETVSADGIGFLSPALRNPLLPLLITICAANGDVAAMDAIPFPSLCRGGWHHAELLSLAGGAGYIRDLRVTGDSFLREIWDAPRAAASRHISDVTIDLRQATGAERILSGDCLQWLVAAQGLKVNAVNGNDGLVRAGFEVAGLAMPSGKDGRKPGLCLMLPADAVPAVAAAVSRRIVHGGDAAAAFLTASAAAGIPQWYVSLPPVSAALAELQPRHLPPAYPLITAAGKARAPVPPEAIAAATAMAIRFTDDAFRMEEQRYFPVAPDIGQILEGTKKAEGAPLLSVIVSVRNGATMMRDLLASLAGQTLAPHTELVLVNNRSNASMKAILDEVAETHFEGRHTIIEADAPFNHSAQANAGVAASRGQFICLADTDVILHDPRTLASLVALAAARGIGAAGCMMLEPKPGRSDGVKFRSAGVFPSKMRFGGPARISFNEPDCGAIFGPATYPVAAIGFALACIRRSVWNELDGLDAERFATDFNDIDFCLRAMAAGHVNVCSTMLSAFHTGRATRGVNFDVLASDRLPAMGLPELLAACTVLRRLG